MRIFRYLDDVAGVPVDFRADPDGEWEYDALVEAAGFDPQDSGVAIGALSTDYRGHADGAAVVVSRGSGYLAVVECLPQPVLLTLPTRPLPAAALELDGARAA